MIRAKFLAGMLAIFSLAFASHASAATLFSYTGNNFTVCFGNYSPGCTSERVSATFSTSLTGSQLANLNNADISASLVAFDFSAIDQIATESNSYDDRYRYFFLSTDAAGNIVNWHMEFGNNNGSYIATINMPTNIRDGVRNCRSFGGTICFDADDAYVQDAGVWAVSGVPEPATWAMLVIGFGAIGGMMRWRRREALAA